MHNNPIIYIIRCDVRRVDSFDVIGRGSMISVTRK